MKRPLILTFTGRRVNPLDIRPEDIDERDVAHHLALINRFNGATSRPITVAQHAVYVSRLLDGTGYEWQALHHDDGEAYVGDVTKWLKESDEMAGFRRAEERAQRSCYEFFNIDPSGYEPYAKFMHPLVEAADKVMLQYEGGESFHKTRVWEPWAREVITYARYPQLTDAHRMLIGNWSPWSWRQAEEAYLLRVRLLRQVGFGVPGAVPPVDAAAVERVALTLAGTFL